MEILQEIRTKLKIGADVPDSAALTQALNLELRKLDKNGEEAQAVRDGLALDALGSDGGKASTDKLEQLGRERLATQAIVDALRVEIAAALKAERTTALQARWDESKRLGDTFLAAATRADAAISAAAATVATAVRELNAAENAFERSLPVRPERPWGYASQRPTARDGVAIASEAISAHARNDRSIEKVPALQALAQDQLKWRLHDRPSTAEQITRALSADQPSEIIQVGE